MAVTQEIISDFVAGRLDPETAGAVAQLTTNDVAVYRAVRDARRVRERVERKLSRPAAAQ